MHLHSPDLYRAAAACVRACVLVFALVSLFRRGMKTRSNSSQILPHDSPSNFAPSDDFPLSGSPEPIKLLMKQSRPMKCCLVRVGGYRGGGGLVPRNLSATPVGVVGAFFNRDVDRKNCPSLLRPVRGDAFIGAVWKVKC